MSVKNERKWRSSQRHMDPTMTVRKGKKGKKVVVANPPSKTRKKG